MTVQTIERQKQYQQSKTRQPLTTNGYVAVPPLESGDHLSRAEFERRYHLHPEIKKAELIEGEVYVASPVHAQKHGIPHFNLITWTGVYLASTPGLEGSDNTTLRLDLDNDPQPDIMLHLKPEFGGRIHITEDDYFEGVPELIVEVAASSASYDLNKKKIVYARNGVLEYLVAQAFERRVDWFILRQGEYETIQPDATGILHSEIFPGLWLPPDAIWTGDLARMLSVLQMGLAAPEHAEFVKKLVTIQAVRQFQVTVTGRNIFSQTNLVWPVTVTSMAE